MRKFLLATAAVAMIAATVSPAAAHDRDDYRDRYDHREHHGSNTGRTIGGLIFGGLVGAALLSSSDDGRRNDRYYGGYDGPPPYFGYGPQLYGPPVYRQEPCWFVPSPQGPICANRHSPALPWSPRNLCDATGCQYSQ